MSRRLAILLPLALGLAACNSDDDPGPGGLTQGEARELNEAADVADINAAVAAPAGEAAP